MRTHLFAIAVVASAAVLLVAVACSRAADTSPTDPSNQVIKTATFDSSLHVDLKSFTVTPSGLYYKDLVVGTGPAAKPGDNVAAGYSGSLTDGRQFDASPPGQPYAFVLGAHRVIAGWDEGVAGMRVGGTRQLVIPSSLGYGPDGSGPIPPNAVLIFTVNLVRAE